MEEPLTVSELMGATGDEAGKRPKHLGVLVSGSAVGFEMTERNVPASRAVPHRRAGRMTPVFGLGFAVENRTWLGLITSRAAKAWRTRIWTVPKLSPILYKLFLP